MPNCYLLSCPNSYASAALIPSDELINIAPGIVVTDASRNHVTRPEGTSSKYIRLSLILAITGCPDLRNADFGSVCEATLNVSGGLQNGLLPVSLLKRPGWSWKLTDGGWRVKSVFR